MGRWLALGSTPGSRPRFTGTLPGPEKEAMMERRTVLVVNDEPGMRAGLAAVLSRGGFGVELASTAEDGLGRLEQDGINLLVTDLRLPGMGGLALVQAARRARTEIPIVIITADGTVEDAVAAMKLGAFDFLTKPFSETDVLEIAGRALAAAGPAAPRLPVERWRAHEADSNHRSIVTRDPAMLRILKVAASVASSSEPVLVQGESGTGKKLLARYVHEHGTRRGRPFLAVNCAALPRELLESDLFGHERGEFTGAPVRKAGKFELANGGTILLHEIGGMERALQAKLLRVLQEHEVDRVSGSMPVPVDVRVVATTTRRLRELVDRGRFREDLYCRLTVNPLALPPLRERRGDVELLAEHFLTRFAPPNRPLALSPEARVALAERGWPGNVRDLENAIERAALVARGATLTAADLGEHDRPLAQPGGGLVGLTVREMERQLILQTLVRTSNNRTQAARLLGISIRTLRNKLAEYRTRGEFEPAVAPGA
jgi:DNA-binding NtrC family response regulator